MSYDAERSLWMDLPGDRKTFPLAGRRSAMIHSLVERRLFADKGQTCVTDLRDLLEILGLSWANINVRDRLVGIW